MGATLKQAKLLSRLPLSKWRLIVTLTRGPTRKEHPVLNTSPILASCGLLYRHATLAAVAAVMAG